MVPRYHVVVALARRLARAVGLAGLAALAAPGVGAEEPVAPAKASPLAAGGSAPGAPPVDLPSRRAIMLRYEDTAGAGPPTATVSVQVHLGGSTVEVPLHDDGQPPDLKGGDRVWCGTAEVDEGVDAAFGLRLNDSEAATIQSRVDKGEQLPQVVFRRDGDNVVASDVSDAPGSAPSGAPGAGSNAGRVPPDGGLPEAPTPPAPPLEEGAPPASLADRPSSLWTFGAGLVVGAMLAAWSPLRRRRARAHLRALPPRASGVGLPVEAGAPLVLATVAPDVPALLDALVDVLSGVRQVVVVGPEGHDHGVPRGGGAWAWRALRPDPLEVVRACATLDSPVLVCAGADALEPPLGKEGPNAVLEELLERARAYPVVVVLGADAVMPADARRMTMTRQGDAFVSADLPGLALRVRESAA